MVVTQLAAGDVAMGWRVRRVSRGKWGADRVRVYQRIEKTEM